MILIQKFEQRKKNHGYETASIAVSSRYEVDPKLQPIAHTEEAIRMVIRNQET